MKTDGVVHADARTRAMRRRHRAAGTDAAAPGTLAIDLLCTTAVALAPVWRILPRDAAGVRTISTSTGA